MKVVKVGNDYKFQKSLKDAGNKPAEPEINEGVEKEQGQTDPGTEEATEKAKAKTRKKKDESL